MLDYMSPCKHLNMVFLVVILYCVCVFVCICVWAQSLGAQCGDDFAGMRAALHGHISVMCEMARKVKAGN